MKVQNFAFYNINVNDNENLALLINVKVQIYHKTKISNRHTINTLQTNQSKIVSTSKWHKSNLIIIPFDLHMILHCSYGQTTNWKAYKCNFACLQRPLRWIRPSQCWIASNVFLTKSMRRKDKRNTESKVTSAEELWDVPSAKEGWYF